MDEREKEERFPGNSHYNNVKKKRPEGDKAVKQVAKGHVEQQKKGLIKTLAETLLVSDMESVTHHIIFDVLVPEIKNMLGDIIHGTTNMMLWGDRRGARTDRDGGRSYPRTSYESYYDRRNGRGKDRDKAPFKPTAKSLVDDIIFDTRIEGEDVLSNMLDLINKYKVASVKDLYTFAGIPSNYTQDKYGWFDLSEATVDRVQTGYLLRLPKPEVIEQ